MTVGGPRLGLLKEHGEEWHVDRVGIYRYVSVGLNEAICWFSLEISQKCEEPAVELWVQVRVME